jgi:hypothetical protein
MHHCHMLPPYSEITYMNWLLKSGAEILPMKKLSMNYEQDSQGVVSSWDGWQTVPIAWGQVTVK